MTERVHLRVYPFLQGGTDMKIIAHRSGPTVLPEQTVQSALLALKEGADMIEVDTRFTKDGAVAVSHDLNVSRVFGDDRNVCDMTAAEFLALRHADAPAYCSHLLKDYLRSGVAPILLHIKESGEKLPALLELLKKHDYLDKVVFGVQESADISVIRAFHAGAKVLAFMPKAENAEEFIAAGADYIRLWEQWLTDERVNAVLSSGRKLWIMANNEELGFAYSSPAILKKWQEMGVDGVLLNDISPAAEL